MKNPTAYAFEDLFAEIDGEDLSRANRDGG